MYTVNPVTITDSNSTTNLVNYYPHWSVGTYYLDDYAVVDHKVYIVVADITTDDPETGAAKSVPTWSLMGHSNDWRLFADAKDSKSTTTEDLIVTLSLGVGVDTLALLGCIGSSISVVMTSDSLGEVYNTIRSLTDPVDDYWEWFFEPYEQREDMVFYGLPTYTDATIVITITPASNEAAIGRVATGIASKLGMALADSTSGAQSFTTRTRDGFGNLTIVARRYIDVFEYKISIKSSTIAYVKRKLAAAASSPSLFFVDENNEAFVGFGLVEDFSIPYEAPSRSKLTIEVKSI